MLRTLALGAMIAFASAQQAAADGKIYVQLPDLSGYEGQAAADFLHRVVRANVVSSNCAEFAVSDEEWSLLTDAADLLAYGQLKLSTDAYDADYYGPAFAALDAPGTCAKNGPDVELVLTELVDSGGSREALPDQDAAYEEWRALMDRLQAEANEPAGDKSKTKVK